MFDRDHIDALVFVIDAVQHPVVAAPGAPDRVQSEFELPADAVWIRRQRAVQELDDRRTDLLGDLAQRLAG